MFRRTHKVAALLGTPALLLTIAAGCSSSHGSSSPGATKTTTKGTASVAYAGSLLDLEEKVVGPAFHTATGYGYSGRGAGSLALSQEIKSGEISPNVFLSIGAAPITALEPKYTSWYVQFATSPVVIAYSPTSRYASELAAIGSGQKPLADLVTVLQSPGFKLGRTDPNVDPQGQAFIEMMQLLKLKFGLAPGTIEKILGGVPSDAKSSEIFDETALEPRLEAGQLDAASAYLSQAIQLHLKYIDLGPALDLGDPADATAYAQAKLTLANGEVVKGKPLVVDVTTIGTSDAAAADAFVAYTLSHTGLQNYAQGGYRLLTPKLVGNQAAVPSSVASEVGT
jgi:molybdate/tungstate transport system substrate-binding protein